MMPLLCFTNLSCEDKDDNVIVNEEPLTSTNYIYEGDLRKFYLQTEIAYLENQIEIWNAVTPNDPDYQNAQEEIFLAIAEIETNKLEITGIANPSAIFVIKPPILPPVPVPSPCNCLNVYNTARNIVLLPNTENISITIMSNTDESLIASTNSDVKLQTIPNTGNKGKYQPFIPEKPNFTGEAFIIVETNNHSYTINLNFHKL